MDYGTLFKRSWDIVWHNKFMLILGFLAALSGVGRGRSGNSSFNGGNFGLDENFDPAFMEQAGQYLPIIISLACFGIFIALLFWVLSAIAKAGMIDTASRVDAGEKSSLKLAWEAGKSKLGRMLGLDFALFGIVIFIGFIGAVVGFGSFATVFANAEAGSLTPDSFGALESGLGFFGFIIACLACLLVPYLLVATVVLPFAQRAIVLEDRGVVESIKRGWQVLRNNIGDVLLLIVLFIMIGIVFGIVSLVVLLPFAALALGPGIASMFITESFNLLSGSLLVVGTIVLGLVGAGVNSIMIAFRSTAVTLAYQEFTDKKEYL